ncbi:DUF3556 domain-containing protein [Mycobacterium sp. Y57]|uniref:DUF3556 domain-containing protein n=1 Tax=Mycolicibacterium xanthum TaxID=2796469 RepID=UPI001C851F3F|nr:DUF3556 domain-containing protein [Mycolicibacterium xanthum]MBX7432614.1 DUF3556 domain-containing protein [Mycolicibacterium xanthum]
MGFLQPNMPVVDLDTWRMLPRAQRIRPVAAHLATAGFGTPDVMPLMYLVKQVLFVLGGMGFALATRGIDGFTDVGSWWTEPIVFQKAVLYTMLIEVVGLGCSFGPLSGRYFIPMGSSLYWLRPGTIRLPPWPGRVPLTGGTTRTPVDVVLYAALLALLVTALLSDGTGPIPALHTEIGLLPVWQPIAILSVLAVAGLRDKVIFLAARGEVYASLTLALLFTGVDAIVAAKVVFLVIWMGAATSKINKHFPFVIASMLSNSPAVRPAAVKRLFFAHWPDDLRPSRLSAFVAHVSTAIEMLVPLVLFFSHGGWVTAVAAVVMIGFHLGILSSFPMGVPLEWNVFMIFGVLWLFVAHAGLGLTDLTNPLPVAALFGVLVAVVAVGAVSPRRVSFLPGMRYYAGNWDTTLWCVKPSADDRIRSGARALCDIQHRELQRLYGSADETLVPLHLAYAHRSMNTHGRALFTLVHRALAGRDEDDYNLCEGELICAMTVGWHFGDGHMHNEQLIAALHERCSFEPDEVRVIILDGQPIHHRIQEYRLVDAATGEFERGYVEVDDLVIRQPWADDVPVHVGWSSATDA